MGCGGSVATHCEPRDAFHAQYTLGAFLDSGGFGKVYAVSAKAGFRGDGELAVKVLALPGSRGRSKRLSAARREEATWRKVGKHPNVVALHAAFFDGGGDRPGTAYFLMERCAGPILECTDLGDQVSFVFCARDVLAALAHIHACGIVHRDVKVDNILVAPCWDGSLTAKLCDFGLAALVPPCGYLRGCHVGTAPYMAPEMVSQLRHSYAVDVWSCGVCCYLLSYGHFPYQSRLKNMVGFKVAIASGVTPSFAPCDGSLPQPSPLVEALVRALLERDARRRPRAAAALELDFLAGSAAQGPWPTLLAHARAACEEARRSAGAVEEKGPREAPLEPLSPASLSTAEGASESPTNLHGSSSEGLLANEGAPDVLLASASATADASRSLLPGALPFGS